jgi:hypothetical protein
MALIAHLIVLDEKNEPVNIDIPFMPVSPKIRNEYRKMNKEHLENAKQLDKEWQAKFDALPDRDMAVLADTKSEYRNAIFELSNKDNIELLKKALNFFEVDKALLTQIRKPNDEWWLDVDSYSIREAVDSFRIAYGIGG